jgi:hypothetical protein
LNLFSTPSFFSSIFISLWCVLAGIRKIRSCRLVDLADHFKERFEQVLPLVLDRHQQRAQLLAQLRDGFGGVNPVGARRKVVDAKISEQKVSLGNRSPLD